MHKFKPPQSEAHIHVNQLHKGQHLLPKKNKAISRVILGRENIVGDTTVPVSSFKPFEPEPMAKSVPARIKVSSKPPNRAADRMDSCVEPTRAKSPLRPPNFYTVRLSNAPIFLRRTTLRPPTLEFLNRSPSPVPKSSNQSPVATRAQSPISRRQSPVKQEVFVQRKEITNNAITKELDEEAKKQMTTQEDIIKLINEAVQTGPLKKTHGTQMTPYDSEASDIAGIYFNRY